MVDRFLCFNFNCLVVFIGLDSLTKFDINTFLEKLKEAEVRKEAREEARKILEAQKAEELLKGVNPDFVSINLIGSSNLNFTQCVDPIAESLANGNSINILNKAPIISNSRTVQQSGGSIKNQLVYLFGSLAAQLSEVSENNINEALSSMKIFTAVSTVSTVN